MDNLRNKISICIQVLFRQLFVSLFYISFFIFLDDKLLIQLCPSWFLFQAYIFLRERFCLFSCNDVLPNIVAISVRRRVQSHFEKHLSYKIISWFLYLFILTSFPTEIVYHSCQLRVFLLFSSPFITNISNLTYT